MKALLSAGPREALTTLLLILAGAPGLHAGVQGGVISPLSVGADARALSLGGAYTSLSADASAVYWNPAGLAWLDRFSLSATHARFFEGTELNSLNWAGDFDELGVVGAGFSGLSTDEFPEVSLWNPTGASITYSTARFAVSYSRRAIEHLGVGITAHVLSEKLTTDEDLGFGVDVGVNAHVGLLSLSGVGRNLVSPSIQLGSVSESLPRSLQIGAGVPYYELLEEARLSGAVEVSLVERRSAQIRAGAEIELAKRLGLRGGYDGDDPTFGVGFRFGDLRVDYALTVVNDIQDSHRFGVNFAFGPSASERESRRARERRLLGESFARHELSLKARTELRVAENFEAAGVLDSALAHYEIARSLDSLSAPEFKIAALARAIEAERQRKADEQAAMAQRNSDDVGASLVTVARELADRNLFGQAAALLENSSGTDIDSIRAEISEKKETWRRTKLAEARGAESAGDHAGALEALSALKTEYPADESIDLHIDSIISRAGHLDLLALASRKLADGEAEKARELSEAVLALDSANASALALRDSALALNDSSDGLDELARDTEAWRAFSEALRLVRAGEVESADRILAELLKRYPENKELLKNRRQIELRLKGAK